MNSPSTSQSILQPQEQVLSTLKGDGTRRWLKPKLSRGPLLKRRRIVAYVLIALFTLIPFIKVAGRPLILLDIPARRFTFFGYVFLPTDTVLLALFLVGVLLSIFLLTALFGRVWCGWACPQTVYMEFVFRPIERLFDRTVGRGGPAKKHLGTAHLLLRYVVYLLVCFYLANTFLAYFVGVDRLLLWVQQSPIHHPIPFLIMASVTGLMMFDFCFFREQLCIIACPYGRLQSVLLDRSSLIVSYDRQRGEPRGKAKTGSRSLPVIGDCVDCNLCVTTCPTGIDIRDGLQLECLHCTQCMDACDRVMQRLGRPEGLIRYSSQASDEGQPNRLLRPRVVIYPAILAMVATLFFVVLANQRSFDATVLRNTGNPYTLAEDGRVRNLLRLKLTNRTDEPSNYQVEVTEPEQVTLSTSESELRLDARQVQTFHLELRAPASAFRNGQVKVRLRIRDQQGDERSISCLMLGPLATPVARSNALVSSSSKEP